MEHTWWDIRLFLFVYLPNCFFSRAMQYICIQYNNDIYQFVSERAKELLRALLSKTSKIFNFYVNPQL